MTMPLRILISVACLFVAAFSFFGFLASFEPGVTIGWKIGYSIMGIVSLGVAVLPWLLDRKPE